MRRCVVIGTSKVCVEFTYRLWRLRSISPAGIQIGADYENLCLGCNLARMIAHLVPPLHYATIEIRHRQPGRILFASWRDPCERRPSRSMHAPLVVSAIAYPFLVESFWLCMASASVLSTGQRALTRPYSLPDYVNI